MKKNLIAIAMICSVMSVSAQHAGDATAWNEVESKTDYNRVSISYDRQHFGYSSDYFGDKDESINLNGFGLNYTHGFGVAENMFVETGLNFNMGFGKDDIGDKLTEDGFYFQDQRKMNNINLRIPINFVYRFNVADKFSISPYAGINFKFNLVSKVKYTFDTNIPEDILLEEGIEEGEWINLFSDSKENMEDKDYTWNRFQMGWQAGVNFEYSKYVLGVQYGTDFIPAYSHKFDDGKMKVNSSALSISVGYTF